jgi:predicted amidohydrolase
VLQRLHAGGVPVPAREAVYVVEAGDVVVHCADGPGQTFVEAEVTTYIFTFCWDPTENSKYHVENWIR